MASLRASAALMLAAFAATSFHSGPHWPTDMITRPAAGLLLAPPEGALSTTAETRLSRDEAGERLPNPLPASPETLARGRRLFETYCAVCHGSAGRGDGPVGKKFGYPVPMFTNAVVVGHPDGYLYGTIRDGGFIMPSYAEVMTSDDRWAVVHHVRSLQKR